VGATAGQRVVGRRYSAAISILRPSGCGAVSGTATSRMPLW
jgi:hypothetical protein